MAAPSTETPSAERRRLVVAGATFFGILIVLIAVAAIVGGSSGDERRTSVSTIACEPEDAVCLAEQRSGERPGIIPQPGEGHSPTDSGEPGGREQIALFGVLVVALAVIVALVVRSTRRAAGRRTPDPDVAAPAR